MFEAVGERWWPTYFAKLASALKPGGKAVRITSYNVCYTKLLRIPFWSSCRGQASMSKAVTFKILEDIAKDLSGNEITFPTFLDITSYNFV